MKKIFISLMLLCLVIGCGSETKKLINNNSISNNQFDSSINNISDSANDSEEDNRDFEEDENDKYAFLDKKINYQSIIEDSQADLIINDINFENLSLKVDLYLEDEDAIHDATYIINYNDDLKVAYTNYNGYYNNYYYLDGYFYSYNSQDGYTKKLISRADFIYFPYDYWAGIVEASFSFRTEYSESSSFVEAGIYNNMKIVRYQSEKDNTSFNIDYVFDLNNNLEYLRICDRNKEVWNINIYTGDFEVFPNLDIYILDDGLRFRLSDDETYYILSEIKIRASEVIIPSHFKGIPVKKISNACVGSYDIRSITLPNTIDNLDGYSFSSCHNLTNINIDSAHLKYKSVNGDVYSKDGKTFIAIAPGKKNSSFVVPNDITSISSSAFYNKANLPSVIIPSSVAYIGRYAFEGWTSSQTIYIQGYLEAPSGWDFEWNKDCDANIVWNYQD